MQWYVLFLKVSKQAGTIYIVITSVMKRARKKSIMIQMLITSKNIGWFWYFVVP
jgi:hypothetical protein